MLVRVRCRVSDRVESGRVQYVGSCCNIFFNSAYPWEVRCGIFLQTKQQQQLHFNIGFFLFNLCIFGLYILSIFGSTIFYC
ncbi:hypothetical protein M6B38_296000 [Iris pallida]|uniref:Uncharacterized protein n=1 Tax=Iris pallida TaxID=29817 RepID=A0AAX6HRB4_IRIPA|nr:hypothetical protein M6B38_296000 [Iris pallida]